MGDPRDSLWDRLAHVRDENVALLQAPAVLPYIPPPRLRKKALRSVDSGCGEGLLSSRGAGEGDREGEGVEASRLVVDGTCVSACMHMCFWGVGRARWIFTLCTIQFSRARWETDLTRWPYSSADTCTAFCERQKGGQTRNDGMAVSMNGNFSMRTIEGNRVDEKREEWMRGGEGRGARRR